VPYRAAFFPGDDVHHRGLAGAVGPMTARISPGATTSGQGVQRLEAVEADGDAVEIEQRARRQCRRGDGHVHSTASRCWRWARYGPLQIERAQGLHVPKAGDALGQEQRRQDEEPAQREQPRARAGRW